MAEAADDKRLDDDGAHKVETKLTSLKASVDTSTSPDQLDQVIADLKSLSSDAEDLPDTQKQIRQEIEVAEHRREQLQAEQSIAADGNQQ